jgi:uncharacterized protein (DUF3084 family)
VNNGQTREGDSDKTTQARSGISSIGLETIGNQAEIKRLKQKITRIEQKRRRLQEQNRALRDEVKMIYRRYHLDKKTPRSRRVIFAQKEDFKSGLTILKERDK